MRTRSFQGIAYSFRMNIKVILFLDLAHEPLTITCLIGDHDELVFRLFVLKCNDLTGKISEMLKTVEREVGKAISTTFD